jgi:hypothetical protein
MVKFMMGYLFKIKKMELEGIIIKINHCMKEIGKMIKEMDMEKLPLKVVISFKGNL